MSPVSSVKLGLITLIPVGPISERWRPLLPSPMKPNPVKPRPVKPRPVKPRPVRPTPVRSSPVRPIPVNQCQPDKALFQSMPSRTSEEI